VLKLVVRTAFAAAAVAWIASPISLSAGDGYCASCHPVSHGSGGGSFGSGGGSYGSGGGSFGSGGGSYGSGGGSFGSGGGSYGSVGGSVGNPYATVAAADADALPARVTVTVPENAIVFVQGQRTNSTGPERNFSSKPIPVGKDFHYTIKVDVERDGQLVSKTARATIRAGQTVQVSVRFDEQQPAELVADVRTLPTN
jgi:uncharacterized protein (TIGR03000 family)